MKTNVHCDKGAYIGGDWVDMEDLGERYQHSDRKKCSSCPRSKSRNCAKRKDGAYDIVIVGAGCIGAAIARELSKTKASVLLLEAADDVTQGATKGNSGIVHAGYDDKPGSVKSKYCWPGNQLFPQLDRELNFGFQRNGSLVVAKSEKDMETLEMLMERGHKNGVKNCRIIGKEELRKMEPYIHEDAIGALYSPDAGTITPYEYTIALAENAVDNGVELRTRRKVVKIESKELGQKQPKGGQPGRFKITAAHWEPAKTALRLNKEKTLNTNILSVVALVLSLAAGGYQSYAKNEEQKWYVWGVSLVLGLLSLFVYFVFSPSPSTLFKKGSNVNCSNGTNLTGLSKDEIIYADYIVNAAGCKSEEVANLVGDYSFVMKPRIGDYILLHKDEGHKAGATLFPCPHPVYGKGVLVQTTLWGNLILGPTARDVKIKNEKTGKYEINEAVQNEPRDNIMGYILSKCLHLVPSLDASQVIHTFAGTRAKCSKGDWIIGPLSSVPGFFHAACIDSPGIAASPAIALDVVKMLKEGGCKNMEKDPNFNPNREAIVVPKSGYKGLKMSKNDWNKVKDPKKNVVCKCEKVTEAEIIDACRRSLPIDSTQAIRKRTRAGMGHCQGDVPNYNCEGRVAAIIARETGIPLEEVGRRPWPASSLLKTRQAYFDEEERQHLVKLSQSKTGFKLHGAAK
eukprot:g4172.t1